MFMYMNIIIYELEKNKNSKIRLEDGKDLF